jgi:2-polyprenyl-6-methoxyphenol hydroxylase-like FAD-dependent oxidoreductase
LIRATARAPAPIRLVACAARCERAEDLDNLFRRPYGNGWALTGDAGYHKNPITAQGITDAFRCSDLLSEAVDEGFSGHRPIAAALADCERRRNEAALPMYELTCQLATLQPPPPEMQRLFAALRDNQADTDRFVGMIAGSVPIPEFFAPENLERIIGRARQPRLRRTGNGASRITRWGTGVSGTV